MALARISMASERWRGAPWIKRRWGFHHRKFPGTANQVAPPVIRPSERARREGVWPSGIDDDAPQFTVKVVYGTSQRITELHRGGFCIARLQNSAAFQAAASAATE